VEREQDQAIAASRLAKDEIHALMEAQRLPLAFMLTGG
jgi:hypothetical protein